MTWSRYRLASLRTTLETLHDITSSTAMDGHDDQEIMIDGHDTSNLDSFNREPLDRIARARVAARHPLPHDSTMANCMLDVRGSNLPDCASFPSVLRVPDITRFKKFADSPMNSGKVSSMPRGHRPPCALRSAPWPIPYRSLDKLSSTPAALLPVASGKIAPLFAGVIRCSIAAMTKSTEAVLAEALRLDVDARAELAAEILASLDQPGDPHGEAAWTAEIDRRIAAVKSGEARLEPWDKLKRRIERELLGRPGPVTKLSTT